MVMMTEATMSWGLLWTKHYIKCLKDNVLFNAPNKVGTSILIFFRKEQIENQKD